MSKIYDAAKYVGKNFWKVLPVGSFINHDRKFKESHKEDGEIINYIDFYKPKEQFKRALHLVYASCLAIPALILISSGVSTGAWTPKQIRAYKEKERIKAQIEAEHKGEINFEYGRIFENSKSFKDSVDIYQKYGLPIKLLEPSIVQKEEAIKKNQLERSVTKR